MTGYWVIRTYKAGAVGEKIKYWVPGQKPSQSQRRLRSEIKKQQQNEAGAEKRMARQIHANFTSEDFLIGLDYSAKGLSLVLAGLDEQADRFLDESYHACRRQLRLWLKRVRRACAKAGIPFRYLAVTSDTNGKTGELVRLHHHVIVNREALAIALEKWTLGGTNHEHLYSVPDQSALAVYLLRQVRRLPDEKKYIPSRNLIVPQPKDRIAQGGAELAVPRGGQLLHRNEWRPGRPQYIRYILPGIGKFSRVRKRPAQMQIS